MARIGLPTSSARYQRCFRRFRSLSRGNLVGLLGLFNSTDFTEDNVGNTSKR